MALVPVTRTLITLPVADRVIADTRIRQVATFQRLTHGQAPDGTCTATITVLVVLYAAAGDELGPALSGPGFSSYAVDLQAANDTLVDARTGAVLAVRRGQNPADWQALIDHFTQPTMLQGDFFEYLRDNGLPGTIRQMIEQYIEQADAAGKFA